MAAARRPHRLRRWLLGLGVALGLSLALLSIFWRGIVEIGVEKAAAEADVALEVGEVGKANARQLELREVTVAPLPQLMAGSLEMDTVTARYDVQSLRNQRVKTLEIEGWHVALPWEALIPEPATPASAPAEVLTPIPVPPTPPQQKAPPPSASQPDDDVARPKEPSGIVLLPAELARWFGHTPGEPRLQPPVVEIPDWSAHWPELPFDQVALQPGTLALRHGETAWPPMKLTAEWVKTWQELLSFQIESSDISMGGNALIQPLDQRLKVELDAQANIAALLELTDKVTKRGLRFSSLKPSPELKLESQARIELGRQDKALLDCSFVLSGIAEEGFRHIIELSNGAELGGAGSGSILWENRRWPVFEGAMEVEWKDDHSAIATNLNFQVTDDHRAHFHAYHGEIFHLQLGYNPLYAEATLNLDYAAWLHGNASWPSVDLVVTLASRWLSNRLAASLTLDETGTAVISSSSLNLSPWLPVTVAPTKLTFTMPRPGDSIQNATLTTSFETKDNDLHISIADLSISLRERTHLQWQTASSTWTHTFAKGNVSLVGEGTLPPWVSLSPFSLPEVPPETNTSIHLSAWQTLGNPMQDATVSLTTSATGVHVTIPMLATTAPDLPQLRNLLADVTLDLPQQTWTTATGQGQIARTANEPSLLELKATAQPEGEVVQVSGTLHELLGRAELLAWEAEVNPTTQAWSFAGEGYPILPLLAPLLGHLLPALQGASLDGDLQYRVQAAGQGQALRGQATLTWQEGRVTGPDNAWVLTDLTADATVEMAPFLRARGEPSLTAASLQVGETTLTDLAVRWQWPLQNMLRLLVAEAQYAGGRVFIEPLTLNPMAPGALRVVVKFTGLDAAQVFSQLPEQGYRITGILDGELPIVWEAGQLRFERGFLEMRPGSGGRFIFEDSSQVAQHLNLAEDQLDLQRKAAAALREGIALNVFRVDLFNPNRPKIPAVIDLEGPAGTEDLAFENIQLRLNNTVDDASLKGLQLLFQLLTGANVGS